LCLVCCLLVLLIHFATPAHAASFVVNTTTDSNDGSCGTPCSLRDALKAANGSSGADTITFAASTNGTAITLGSALPQIADELTITGNGEANTIVDGASSYQVFDIASGVTVSLGDMTIQNGKAGPFEGTGINNLSGKLTVTHCTLSGNDGDFGGLGGAIGNDSGTVTVRNSTFSANHAALGGAIGNSSGTVTVTDSTFSGNYAGVGGAIGNTTGKVTVTDSFFFKNVVEGSAPDGLGGGISNGGMLTVSNSTFFENAGNAGGGIANAGTATVTNSTFYLNVSALGAGIGNQGTLTVTNSTLSGNSAPAGVGGGIANASGTITLNNSIVANSLSGGDCYLDPTSPGTVNASHSLIMDSANACGVTNGTASNLVGVDPLLGSLADNGGPTQTMLPAVGSPVIDAGSNSLAVDADSNPLANDQRGDPRIGGSSVDMGAVEVLQAQLSLTVGGGGSSSAGSDPSLIGTNIAACSNATCSASYDIEGGGPTITLSAAPDTGYHVAGWSGDCAGAGSSSTAMVTVHVDRTCGVTFALNPHTIGGTVTGLTGSGLVLQDNGGDDLPISADGTFAFSTPIVPGNEYAVTVSAQPSDPAQTCTVANGTGTVGSGDVTDVAVSCITAVEAIPALSIWGAGLLSLLLILAGTWWIRGRSL
jgi:CSLREA domain-containing protein